jgi:PBP1b-binding outer membrane lipoprotein LpoB
MEYFMKQNYNRIALATLLTTILSGCGSEPEWVEVYDDCKEKMGEVSEQMKENSEKDPNAKAMIDAMGGMVTAMGMAACESIKQMCEPNPDGDMCQAVIQEYKKSNTGRE